MHSPGLPRNRTTSVERRRHLRHNLKSSTTVVVELGPNNGGNLLDIGGGGLSLQAVARLNPETELSLRFRLQGIAQAVETVGRVTWLGPTQKVAGISFKNLPGSTEQQIVEWVARQEPSAQNNSSGESADPPPPISQYGRSLQEKIVLAQHESLESLAKSPEPLLETITLSKSATTLSSRRSVSLDPSLISPADVSSRRDRMRESFASESRRRRRKISIAIIIVVIGIFALAVVTPQGRGLVDRTKAFLGIGAPEKMDPAKAGVPVWVHGEYYYCADNPNFKNLQPGSIMTQGEALQYSYKPKLGYCQ